MLNNLSSRIAHNIKNNIFNNYTHNINNKIFNNNNLMIVFISIKLINKFMNKKYFFFVIILILILFKYLLNHI